MTLEYGIEIVADDNQTYLVTCPQLPMVVTFGETIDEARRHAVDAIETALASMIDDGEPIPQPLPAVGHAVRLPLSTGLKVQLSWAMRESGVGRDELSRRLGWTRDMLDELFQLDAPSDLTRIESAFHALGRSLDVEVRNAA